MLGSWLSDVLSSRVKTKILRLFSKFPAKEFTGREIARTIEVSHRSVDLALSDLVSHDIVTIRRIGRANVYTANRDSYLFLTIRDLFKREEESKDNLMKEIRKIIPDVISCVIFGSVARNEERPDSDIDLLIVSANPKSLKEPLAALESRLMKKFALHTAPIILTPRQLKKKLNSPYVKSARKEGLLVSGSSLEDVVARRS